MRWLFIIWFFLTVAFSGFVLWKHHRIIPYSDIAITKHPGMVDATGYPQTGKALLASRFDNLAAFKDIVDIQYDQTSSLFFDTINHVYLQYLTPHGTAMSHLSSGISQSDVVLIKKGSLFEQLGFLFSYPFCVSQRYHFLQSYHLSRRLHYIYGEGDVAFYDLALQTYHRIIDKKEACQSKRDSSEKGFINTFNHVTGQAMITTLFSEETADMLSILHERKTMNELTTGQFSTEQLNDPDNNPIDNYVDMINNEWGHQIGHVLRDKYKIHANTIWTAALLTNYINDLCDYYCWSFSIRIQPFTEKDDIMIRYAQKINRIMSMNVPT